MRPNENFSGRGHARHLCRDCARLPKEELEYRSGMDDVRRATRIPGQHLAALERYLEHPNERVRIAVRRILEEHERERATALMPTARDDASGEERESPNGEIPF